jgi:hypothetical protein
MEHDLKQVMLTHFRLPFLDGCVVGSADVSLDQNAQFGRNRAGVPIQVMVRQCMARVQAT